MLQNVVLVRSLDLVLAADDCRATCQKGDNTSYSCLIIILEN